MLSSEDEEEATVKDAKIDIDSDDGQLGVEVL